jgi:hypothetical protein
MAATYPLKLVAWNNILTRINNLASFPPDGCDPIAQLPLVTAPHKWSVQDITAAQNKLKEICSENTFTTAVPGGKWRKLYIDELDAAIDNGWCNCEPQLPCCIPKGQGTVWIEGPGGGYYVTIPYWQIIEQYLYANISYGAAEAALPEGVMAHLVACYPGSSVFIPHSLHHNHWVNCIYQDRWLEGGNRGEEYWSTCGSDPVEITYLGRLPAIAPDYHGGTSVGGNNYYDQPMNMGYHYDYIEQRWYATWWIGYFEVDSYSYYFDFSLFRCPT